MATAVQEPTVQLPSIPPERPRRRTTAIVAAGTAAGLAVVGLSLTALRNDSRTLRASAPVTTTSIAPAAPAPTPTTTVTVGTTPATTLATAPAPPTTLRTVPPTTAVTAPPAPPTTVAERLTLDSRLRVDGLGPVRIGMTLEEASRAAGVTIRLHPEESGGLDCTYAHPLNGSDETAFMVVGGRIVRIDIGIMGPDRVRTLSGIGKGSTEADVLRTYPGQIRVEPHPYIPGAHNLVYVPTDPAFRPYLMIFEAVDGRVTAFRSGLADPVSWIEGCS